jgi:hypothetical protein
VTIFLEEHIRKIITGAKTQTRRVMRPYKRDDIGLLLDGEIATSEDGSLAISYRGEKLSDKPIHAVYSVSGGKRRIKWEVGRTYAVQPGRGKPGAWWHPETRGWAIPYTTKKYKFGGPQRLRREMEADGWQPLRIRIMAIRAERLQDISEADAVAEGCEPVPCRACGGAGWFVDVVPYHEYPHEPYQMQVQCQCFGGVEASPSMAYQDLWECINGSGTWDANPRVWVLEFEVVAYEKEVKA